MIRIGTSVPSESGELVSAAGSGGLGRGAEGGGGGGAVGAGSRGGGAAEIGDEWPCSDPAGRRLATQQGGACQPDVSQEPAVVSKGGRGQGGGDVEGRAGLVGQPPEGAGGDQVPLCDLPVGDGMDVTQSCHGAVRSQGWRMLIELGQTVISRHRQGSSGDGKGGDQQGPTRTHGERASGPRRRGGRPGRGRASRGHSHRALPSGLLRAQLAAQPAEDLGEVPRSAAERASGAQDGTRRPGGRGGCRAAQRRGLCRRSEMAAVAEG